jgi:hypothetical protein
MLNAFKINKAYDRMLIHKFIVGDRYLSKTEQGE